MYKLEVKVDAMERDEIIAGIESVAELVEKQLVEAGKYGLDKDTVIRRAKLVHEVAKLKHYFGWKHEYKTTES